MSQIEEISRGDWSDDDDNNNNNNTTRVPSRKHVRDFIHEDKSAFAFDMNFYHTHPYPRLAFVMKDGGEIYAGNALHGAMCNTLSGKIVHFRTIINLHSPEEHNSLSNIKQISKTIPKIKPGMEGVNPSIINRPLPTNNFDGNDAIWNEEIAKDIMDVALAFMKSSPKPILIRCVNGMTRTIACLTAHLMLEKFLNFKDAYQMLDNNLSPAYINLAYEKVLVTEIHQIMMQRRITTIPMDMLRPIIDDAKKNKIAPFNVQQGGGKGDALRVYAMQRAAVYANKHNATKTH